MREKPLPETREELREWIEQAWNDGWQARKDLVGKPLGTIIHDKPKRLRRFLVQCEYIEDRPILTSEPTGGIMSVEVRNGESDRTEQAGTRGADAPGTRGRDGGG